MRTPLWSSIGCLLLAVGCGEGAVEGEDFDQTEEAVVKTNGIKLNGIKLNGIKLNGIKLNGIKLNGTTLVGGVKLAGSRLMYTKSDGLLAAVTAGSTLVGALANGTTVTLKIASIWPSGDRYGYSVYDGSGTPICGWKSAGVPYLAYPLAGRWDESAGTSTGGDWFADSTTFTFACQSAALGKCVELGYRPWVTSLKSYHQACTRMIRADYCGDGTAWTAEGTPVDIYDKLSIQLNAAMTTTTCHFPDAEWGPGGAVCMNSYRVLYPSCRNALFSSGCAKLTSSWNAPGLVRSELVTARSGSNCYLVRNSGSATAISGSDGSDGN